MDEYIRLKELPHTLVDDIITDVAQYTVGFLDVRKIAHRQQVGILGSGVLVSVGTTRAILTAHHVVRVLPRMGRLGVVLGRTEQHHTIDTQGAAFLEIARGTQDARGPDLGALVLAPPIASSLASLKTFYNLDARREQLLHCPPEVRDGCWVAQGFLDERSVITPDPDGRGQTKGYYNFTGIGGPEAIEQVDEYDYVEFPVSNQARHSVPRSWGGMSGGGLWQIPLLRQGQHLTYCPPLLSGLLFYQHPTTATACGVRGHGRRSVYEHAYTAIQRCAS